MSDVNTICKVCGYAYEEHQFDTKRCPLKESAFIGEERYEWADTMFREIEEKEHGGSRVMNTRFCRDCLHTHGPDFCGVSGCINLSSWESKEKEQIHHPQHYGGADNPYEAIKVIEAWGLGFCLGNTVKYISRAGKKSLIGDTEKEHLWDLEKAAWYLNREIQRRQEKCK